MFMFFIEIGLIILVWRSGWKWRALIPIGFLILIAFSMGFGVGYTGSGGDLYDINIVLESVTILVLFIMLISKRSGVKDDTVR